ncbi:endonuclease III-like protein 1 [Episyrphus balteatus]|uniref:endonuclease III-like protein 1 n=1 Tax=Episyrphus balteatus TaxID=286459 RepID=UPI0024850A3D|nr:endonuclease III-like protein 1 [Episyrphus balteatus]
MNLFKRIGNIFMKMAPRRKPVNLPEKLIQQEDKIKVEPINDIEDLIKKEPITSPYFSPMKTRNQRLNADIKPTSSLASQVIPPQVLVKNVKQEPKPKKQSVRETKKQKEMQAILEGLKKLPEVDDGPLEVFVKPEPVTIVEPIATKLKKTVKTKRVPKETAKSVKSKSANETPESSNQTVAIKNEESPSSPIKVVKRKSKDSSKSPEHKLERWEPNNWSQILDNIRVMRANVPAPVDTMGCDRCADENADEKTKRFHVLLALMLSSQTKDEVTHEAMKRLTADNNCTPQIIADMEPQKLETLLYPVSFYKNKAKYLKNTSKVLVEEYNSDIPNDIKGLMKLPGVGPKMAHICMNAAWDIVTGIGVDVHVHRISNRLGWVRQETKQPEQTRKELESWLPSAHWKEVNHLLVGFGQTVCTPLKPKCGECLNKTICPAAFLVKPKKVKPEKVVL